MARPRLPIARRLLIAAAVLSIAAAAPAEDARPLSPELSKRIPAAYREKAKAVRLSASAQKYYAQAPDAELFSAVAEEIASTRGGVEFLVAAADRERSAELRRVLFGALGYSPALRTGAASQPAALAMLARHARSDPDAAAALAALNALRRVRMEQLGGLLAERMTLSRVKGDQDGLELLSEEQSRRYKWFGEVASSAATRDAPPVFAVAPPGQPIRAVAFGDFGSGQESQNRTAAAIRAYATTHPFDFGVTLGDNFYPTGMDGPFDPRWKTDWEDLYGPLGIRFYASLGNHDYGQAASPLSEMWYSAASRSWHLPARYYTFTAGPAQFFQVDTVDLSERELRWLDEELAKSAASWKIVYGHYQIYSATRGDNDAKQDDLVHRLLPVLKKGGVDLYLCGHDHNLQILKPDGGVNFVVAGAGGADLYDFEQEDYERSEFKSKSYGFAVLDAQADGGGLDVRLVDVDGRELDVLRLRKDAFARTARGASPRRESEVKEQPRAK